MYTVWHVGKYKITFKLVISHWANGNEHFDTFTNIILLRTFPL